MFPTLCHSPPSFVRMLSVPLLLGMLAGCQHEQPLYPVEGQVTLDGKNVPLTEVKTPPLNIVLPEDNIFDELGIPTPGGTGVSVAHGFVALLGPLDPGTHTIVFTGNFPTGTTTIVVESGQ